MLNEGQKFIRLNGYREVKGQDSILGFLAVSFDVEMMGVPS
jgi:hypothetical protein